MPVIQSKAVNMGNSAVTEFVDTVGTTDTSYTFQDSNARDYFKIENIGAQTLVITISGQSYMLQQGQTQEVNASYTTFSVRSQIKNAAFRVRASYFIYDDEDEKKLSNQLIDLSKQLTVAPVGFRDGGIISRANANQTGTTRIHLFPQFDCQDLVLVYSNYYQGASTTPTPNTNSITVKASLEINGVITPVFFNGKRTTTIEGGAVIYSDPIGCMISPSDSVWVRTYFDAGVGGYIPTITTLCEINGVKDGVTYGSDLSDIGTVTETGYAEAYVPSAVLGTMKENKKSFLLVGDSIMNGAGDVFQLSGNTGFAARRLLSDKIGSTKVSMGGETAQNFLKSLYCRAPFIKNHTDVICNYGINDISASVTLDTLKTTLLKIWKYFANRGLNVYQTTITPKTTTTDNWLTLANQTITAQESVRIQINAWLRDPSTSGAVAQSGGDLVKVLDTAAKVENNGKWIEFSTPIYSGTVQSATATSLTDSNLSFSSRTLDLTAVVKITGGTGAGQIVRINNNYVTSILQMKTSWTTTPDATSTYEIYYVPTQDGTHPSPKAHGLMTEAVNI
jgi:lysophospholipase L1-like esterase